MQTLYLDDGSGNTILRMTFGCDDFGNEFLYVQRGTDGNHQFKIGPPSGNADPGGDDLTAMIVSSDNTVTFNQPAPVNDIAFTDNTVFFTTIPTF